MRRGFLLLDLGDVVWDECPAQRHMMQTALGALPEFNEDDWNAAYQSAVSNHVLNRFMGTLRILTNNQERIEEVIRLVNQDFFNMPLMQYVGLHPLREDFYSSMNAIRKDCDVAIIANQHVKAQELVSYYNIDKYVDFIALSGFFGKKKPSLDFFSSVLRKFTNDYVFKLMVGNRIDLDLMPAHFLGLRT